MSEQQDGISTAELLKKLGPDMALHNLKRNGITPKREKNSSAQACVDSFYNGVFIAMSIVEQRSIEELKSAWVEAFGPIKKAQEADGDSPCEADTPETPAIPECETL